MLVENQKVMVKWNGANRKHYESVGYIYTKSGNEFEININHITKGSNSIVEFECDWCHEHFYKKYKTAMRYDHQFCSNNCQHKFNSKVKLEARPWKKCEWCNKEYQVTYYAEETSRFCSRECLTKWQSEAFKGAGSSRYVERAIVQCDWCKKDLERTPYELENRTYNFCDRECQRNWHREVFVKSEKFIEINRQTMIDNLTSGKISFTNSKPQVILNKLLSDKKIKFTNEKQIGEFSLDVYLNQYNLYIEVNGGFWHVDNRFYDEINYDMQLNRIISDKRKKTYIKNKLNKNILYLWEFDIETNLELCYKLILKFIENKGKLKNYHSFNYFIKEDGKLNLGKENIIPYMDWDAKKLTEIVDLSVREHVNRFQPEKHITFNCEFCGEEKTQYVYTYIKSKNHFCSVKCKNLSQQVGNNTNHLSFIHKCTNCNKDIELPNHRHLKIINGEQKNVFCSTNCKSEWESKNKIGKNNPNYNQVEKICEYCGKEYSIPQGQNNRSHYCSVECRQKGQRNRIIVNCLNCGLEVEKTPTDIKNNKSGEYFCSHDCHNEYTIKKHREIRNCEYCGDEFITRKKSTQKYCCISCRNKDVALKIKVI